VCYAYLWHAEKQTGAEEGRKDRPCAIVIAVDGEEGDALVYVAPITHRPPDDPADAVELPPRVKQHLGLDDDASWIVATELNAFVWPGFDLRPIARDRPDECSWGHLPRDLFRQLRERILENRRMRRMRITQRD
jgi:hypothetical protein